MTRRTPLTEKEQENLEEKAEKYYKTNVVGVVEIQKKISLELLDIVIEETKKILTKYNLPQNCLGNTVAALEMQIIIFLFWHVDSIKNAKLLTKELHDHIAEVEEKRIQNIEEDEKRGEKK